MAKKKKKPESIYKKQELIPVDYGALERFIKDKTGKGVEIPQVLECANDTQHEVSVHANHAEDDYDQEEQDAMDDFLFDDGSEPEYMHIHQLMNALCRHGIIEPGEYLIKVSC